MITRLHRDGIMGTAQVRRSRGNPVVTLLSAQTGYIVPQVYEIYRLGPGDKKNAS